MKKTKLNDRRALTETQDKRILRLFKDGYSASVIQERFYPTASMSSIYRARTRAEK